MTGEQMKKTVFIRERLDDVKNRHYVVTDSTKRDYKKRYQNVEESKQLYSFAVDYYGMTSDCYILYALCHLGVADYKTIHLFLKALASTYKDLRMAVEEEGLIVERLRVLYKMGLVCRFSYDLELTEVKDVSFNKIETVALYVAAPRANDIVRQSLRLVLPENKCVEMKQLTEIVGWACAARVGAEIASGATKFVDYLQRYIRTKQLGTAYFPSEVLTEVEGTRYYTAVLDCYIGMDKEIQTPRMYAEYCGRKIDTIKNYINCRTTKGVASVVVAVRDNADLNELASMIAESGALKGLLGNVYFTGEGPLISGLNIRDCFLQMEETTLNEKGYNIFQSEPAFL